MNVKEISEIRRRLSPDKNNISVIRGCYVNEKGEIISEFSQSLSMMPEDEAEKYLALLKKALSGSLDKNLIGIEFSTQQVTAEKEHGLLMSLRKTSLKDKDVVHTLFERIIPSVSIEGNFLILLAHDAYDVPYRSGDGFGLDDASEDMFSYVLCSVCPVKLAKPALSYHSNENQFHSRPADWVVSPPELGFMFPAFDDRSANIYGALYYTRSATDNHTEFVDAVFSNDIPMPADAQKQAFQSILSEALQEECNYELIHAVQDALYQMILEHKENKEDAPPTVTKGDVKKMLQSNGASETVLTSLEEKFTEKFGDDAWVNPANIIEAGPIKLTAPDLVVQIGTNLGDRLETRMIDGRKYVLIQVEDGVELNGVPIIIA